MSNPSNVPGPAFADLGLSSALLRAISDAGYVTPTPIQAKAVPVVLAGGDLLAAAQTGTGKTAGFTLPVLQRLGESGTQGCKPGRPRCLVLVPTRELAAQVRESVVTYGKYLPVQSMVLFGGVGMQPQIQALRRRVDLLVATPGRLLDHCGQKTVDLSGVEILVLDEADRMLDMGFIPDIRKILARLPKARQTLLFSATFSEEMRAFAETLLHEPSHVEVAPRNAAADAIEQTVHLVAQQHKRDLLSHLIRHHGWRQVLVFTRTKHGANRLAEKLARDGITAAAIHGNKSQSARTLALARFRDGSLPVLVATDIAARGFGHRAPAPCGELRIAARAGGLCTPHRSYRSGGRFGDRRVLGRARGDPIASWHRAAPPASDSAGDGRGLRATGAPGIRFFIRAATAIRRCRQQVGIGSVHAPSPPFAFITRSAAEEGAIQIRGRPPRFTVAGWIEKGNPSCSPALRYA